MIGGWPRTSEGVVPRLLIFLGPVGSGKTELAIALAPQLAPKDRTLVVGHVPKVAERLGVPFHRVNPYQKKEIQEFFARVEGSDDHLLYILDDADIYMTANAYSAPALYTLINTGRNYGKGGILIGHGSNTLPKNLILNAHLVAFFRTTIPNVLEWAEDFMWRDWPFGADDREKKADLNMTIRNLPEHQFLLYTPLDTVKFPGFGKVVNGQVMVFPMKDAPTEEVPEDEGPDDAESADATSPPGPAPSTAPDAGATPLARPTSSGSSESRTPNG